MIKATSLLVAKAEQLLDRLDSKQKKLLISLLSILTVILLFLCIVPSFQAGIREKQVNSLLMDGIVDGKNFKAVAPQKLEELIVNNKEVTILFVDPKHEQIEEVAHLIKNKKEIDKMTDKVYVYPIVYQKEMITNFFNLSKGSTLLHFKDKKETYRVNFTSSEEIEFYFFDFLEDLSHKNEKN